MEELLKVRASHIPKKFQEQCTTLLSLFGVILRIDEKRILIPSQMPQGPPDILATHTPPLLKAKQSDAGLQYRSLSRYWFMNFLPEGFWPRLICRLVVDQVLRNQLEKIAPTSKALATVGDMSSTSPWEPWRKGLVWVAKGRPILEVSEVPNNRDTLLLADGSVKDVLSGDYRLELHCHLYHCEAIKGIHLQDEEERESVSSGLCEGTEFATSVSYPPCVSNPSPSPFHPHLTTHTLPSPSHLQVTTPTPPCRKAPPL